MTSTQGQHTQKFPVQKWKAPHWLLNGTYVHMYIAFTKISCMKTESPTLVVEWYVRRIHGNFLYEKTIFTYKFY